MEPLISIIASGNLYMRQMRFEHVGDIEHGHCHTYDHLTLLAKGSLKVTVDGVETVFEAPTAIKILAGKVHQLEALEDDTLAFCVHALRDAVTGDILPPATNHTKERVKVLDTIGDITYVKPTSYAAEVDGQKVELAPIAVLDMERLKGQTFNRKADEKPLKVCLPTGELEGEHFR